MLYEVITVWLVVVNCRKASTPTPRRGVEAVMSPEALTETAHQAGGHAEEGFDAGAET